MKTNYHSRFQVIVFLILLLSPTFAGSIERIIGGEAVQDSSIYPWMVAIVDGDSDAVDGLMCGGVLVAPYLVLTAAHCVDRVDDTDSVNVIIGTVDLENVNNAEIIGVDSTIIYPHYFNSWIDTNSYSGGDLGFLVLSDSSNVVNTYINIPDETTNGEPGDPVIVLGYSYTIPDSLAHVLKQAQIIIQPIDTCKNNFSQPDNLYPELHVCAGNDDGDGACAGDSGGPLVLNHEGTHILNGIVSGGTNLSCSYFSGPEDFFGIYAKFVSAEVDEDIAKFKILDSILITNDHEIIMSLKDPWYVYQGQQTNQFYSLSDSTYEVFLDQDPGSGNEYYALKTIEYSGTDSLWFDRWEAYDDQNNIDSSGVWAELSTPNSYDSSMVIFKRGHAKVKALYVDVSGDPSTPTNFIVDTSGDHPVLSWSPNSEKDLDHYKIRVRYWTKSDQGVGWHIKATTTDTSYTDTNVDIPGEGLPDFIAYKISAVDAFDNASTETDSIKISGDVITWPIRENTDISERNMDIPDKFIFTPAYPNPFNPKVSIHFGLHEGADFIISIYNSIGEKIDVLSTGYFTSGYHTLTWEGNKYPSGIYHIRIDSDKIHETQKVILLN